jgi:hypothetical protein
MLQLLLLTGEPVSCEAHLAQLLGQLFTWTLKGGGGGQLISAYRGTNDNILIEKLDIEQYLNLATFDEDPSGQIKWAGNSTFDRPWVAPER